VTNLPSSPGDATVSQDDRLRDTVTTYDNRLKSVLRPPRVLVSLCENVVARAANDSGSDVTSNSALRAFDTLDTVPPETRGMK
jgi:hypothetical protein